MGRIMQCEGMAWGKIHRENGMITEQQESILEGINREKIRWMKKTPQGEEAYTSKSVF
jgi:hypothetical protein